MSSCVRKIRKFLSVVKALISRGLFVLHGLICIWRVVVIKENNLYWALSATLPFMIIESVFTLCRKRNSEWKWVCPSAVLYLGTAVPAIWFLELDVLNQRMMAASRARWEAAVAAAAANRHPSQGLTVRGSNKSDMGAHKDFIHQGGIVLPMQLGTAEWCKVLEQMLLLILIVGRWLLPKGEITREQLSQLLLVYIGMAADIIELFEAFKEEKVSQNPHLVTVILALWTASLTQFTLVVTATKSKKTRPALTRSPSSLSDTPTCGRNDCCPTEVVSIFISVMLQDAPFLVLRLLLIFRYDVLSYTNIFFTSKNSLVLVLQIYRLVVLFSESRQPPTPFTHSTEVLSSSPASSQSSSLLNLHGAALYDRTLSYDQSSFSDGDIRKKRMEVKTVARERGGCRNRSYKRDSPAQNRSARLSHENETKSGSVKHFKAKNGPVAITTRSEGASPGSKSHNRKLPNASFGRKSKQSERGLAARQEAEVQSSGKQAKKSGPVGTASHSGTPKTSRKSAQREGQTTDKSSGKGHGSLKVRVKKIERQAKVTSSTTPPTDWSEEDKLAERSRQRSGVKMNHHRSLGESSKEDGRFHRESHEILDCESQEEQEDGETIEDCGGIDPDTFVLEDHSVIIDKQDVELCAAGRPEAVRQRDKDHWCSVKDLKTALTFLNEADGYKTVVLKSGKGGPEMVVLTDED
ncbi:hypothetical protein RRG08_059080 [Elysia crispata]|uniref:Transmembrane protein 26 n=1 Tax=Elysia crispata TaxID=231223 RepID=A0AAE1B8H0_9GAST|nr:hypothetical protein RRG08_059080 [Elysia crispata]